jgi:hypothetical protein
MHKFVLVLTFALLTSLPCAAAETQEHTVAVMGEAEIKLPPDFADVEVGVVTQGVVVADALADNNARMNHVIDALRALHIPDKDIRTSEFTIQPKYESLPQGQYDYQAFRQITGYYISNSVTVSVTDMTKIASVIDTSVKAGANASGKVEFHVKNLTEHMDEARKAAVENAHHKALVLTEAAHMTLGPALSITDNEANTSYNNYSRGGAVESVVVTASEAGTPIAPGEMTMFSQITVVYTAGK